jgi:hypothetical protein
MQAREFSRFNFVLSAFVHSGQCCRFGADSDLLGSDRFEMYPEDGTTSSYGQFTDDPWGKDFPDFEYTSGL